MEIYQREEVISMAEINESGGKSGKCCVSSMAGIGCMFWDIQQWNIINKKEITGKNKGNNW